jgi:hypothetical protein
MKFTGQILIACLSSSVSGAVAQSLRSSAIPASIQPQQHQVQDLTAVIHIGPMKTGSSAIQASLGIVVPEIESIDNYEDAGFAMSKGIEAYHMVGCFRPDAVLVVITLKSHATPMPYIK